MQKRVRMSGYEEAGANWVIMIDEYRTITLAIIGT